MKPERSRIRWLGGREYEVEDLRHLPGNLAFIIEGHGTKLSVTKETALEAEIAGLLDGSSSYSSTHADEPGDSQPESALSTSSAKTRPPRDKVRHLLDQFVAPGGIALIGVVIQFFGAEFLGGVLFAVAVLLLAYNLIEWSGR